MSELILDKPGQQNASKQADNTDGKDKDHTNKSLNESQQKLNDTYRNQSQQQQQREAVKDEGNQASNKIGKSEDLCRQKLN